METQPPLTRLKIIGNRITAIDRLLSHLIGYRFRLAEEVAMLKLEDGDEFIREKIENDRMDDMARYAILDGYSPNFARAILYTIIGESCKTQLLLADEVRRGGKAEVFTPSYEVLQGNLLALTAAWASEYDSSYGKGHPATTAFSAFEQKLLGQEIERLPKKRILLDLGCATGKVSRQWSKRFGQIIGFDLSKEMVEVGNRIAEEEERKNVSLQIHDVETRWPLPDGSTSFVLMNAGTGSDIKNLSFVLEEINRVLTSGGRFLLSFYNKVAWSQKIFFPWPLPLAAGLDPERRCLEVHHEKRIIPIYARPYSVAEVEEKISKVENLNVTSTLSYPTIQSILPTDILGTNGEQPFLERLDEHLANDPAHLGSYIIITGSKN